MISQFSFAGAVCATLALSLAGAACGDAAGSKADDTTQATDSVASDVGNEPDSVASDVGNEPDTTNVEPEDPTIPFKGEFDSLAVARKCKDQDDGTNCVEPASNAVRIDDERRLRWSGISYDKEKRLLEFDLAAGTTLDPRIVAGAFLYRGRRDRDQIMHRVIEVRQDGQHVGIKLEEAKLKEVFRRGRIRARIPLEEAPAESTPGMQQGALTATLGKSDCSGNIFDKVVAVPAPYAAAGNIKLDLDVCSFTLTAYVDAVLRWDAIANLDKLEIVVGGGLEAQLHAALDVDLTGKYGTSKTIWTGPPIVFPIAGIPITATPSLIAGFDIDAAATIAIEAGFDYSASIKEGFGWSDKLGWYTIDARTTTWSAFGPNVSFDGSLLATVYLKPRVDVKALGLVGGYVALKAFAEADLTSTAKKVNGKYEGELCADLTVGVTPSIGASASIVGISLFDEEQTLFTLRKKLVTDACTDWSGPIPTDCDLASDCCSDGECPPLASDPYGTDTCEKGNATTNGQFKYTCEHHFSDDFCLVAQENPCDDGSVLTTDSCIDYHCENVPINGLVNGPVQGAQAAGCRVGDTSCCFVDSDCADGNPLTSDACEKTGDAGINVSGSCTHTPMSGQYVPNFGQGD